MRWLCCGFPSKSSCKKACACTLIYTYAHTHKHAHIHTCMPKHAHMCTHMHTHAHASTHTCTHTCLVNAPIKGLCSLSSGHVSELSLQWPLLLPSSAIVGAGNSPALKAAVLAVPPKPPSKPSRAPLMVRGLPSDVVHTECRSIVDLELGAQVRLSVMRRDSHGVSGIGSLYWPDQVSILLP